MTESVNFLIPYHYDDGAQQRAINMREIERMLNDIITGNVAVGGSTTGTWTAFTPTITASSGSITTVSASGRYIQTSGIVFFQVRITITTNGTGATELLMTLPVNAATTGSIGSGKEIGVTNDMVTVQNTASTQCTIHFYNGNYPGADGAIIDINGFYEAEVV